MTGIGGQIAIDSAVGQGTVVRVVLPSHREPVVAGAHRLIFLSGGVFTAQTRERLDQIGAPQLEKPVSAQELRAWVVRVADG